MYYSKNEITPKKVLIGTGFELEALDLLVGSANHSATRS